ncbi:MAG: hypothetical protein FWG74_07980, partial [Planctomycetes bacterium]|nr:hypothetical protein [Planctomycetota bacterium]
LSGQLDYPTLAAAITVGSWSDRLLGTNRKATVPVDAAIVITGVNIQIGGDMNRRCVLVRLDPATEKPWETPFEFDPEVYVKEHRTELIGALLTLVRNWIAQGRPLWTEKAFGSFESWSRVVGGVLQAAGVEGFLANLGAADIAVNRETDSLAAFFSALRLASYDAPIKSVEIADILSGVRYQGTEARTVLRASLPEELLSFIDQPLGRIGARVTRVLRKYEGRHAGGLKLVSHFDSHTKCLYWRILPATAGEAAPAEPQREGSALPPAPSPPSWDLARGPPP